jgi:N-methylhydantoinase B
MAATTFKFRTHPADFEVLNSAMRTITLEMGITMERTSRSPIYFAAHDFSTAIFDKDGGLVALTEYIPIHICAAPFAIRAVLQYFKDDVKPGDMMLVNDPYTLDGGNHLADWTILLPIFYKGELVFWAVNRAHQQDVGGGAQGAYNPDAIDVFAEGTRIPPIKIFEGGKLRRDVFDFVLANVRFPEVQRGDLWSMIGSVRVGERRLIKLLDNYGTEKISDFLLDLYNYTESLMRDQIDQIPDGTYYGESSTCGTPKSDEPGAVTVRCKLTVKGSNMIIDLSDSDPMVPAYINSPISNTYSSVFIAIMTSVGRTVNYRAEGCLKPVEIRTKPGTVTHAVLPATHGNCTNFVAKNIIEAVWDALAKVIPDKTPAGWGAINCWVISGIDPRRNEGYGTPDFPANACGAGAIWGTDGWNTNAPQICSGGLHYPEIEVCEITYPQFYLQWELATDSAGPGKWRGGVGVRNIWVSEAGQIRLFNQGEPCQGIPSPSIAGGKPPPPNLKKIIWANGVEEKRSREAYVIGKGDRVWDFSQGGCGVGNPLERDVKLVQEDVRNELVSIKSARADYGVVIDPKTLEVDQEQTSKLREEMKKSRSKKET